jgi:hypothetical protein
MHVLRLYSEIIELFSEAYECIVHAKGMLGDVAKRVHAWLHPLTSNHTGRIVIHIHQQYRSCLSSLQGTTTPLMMAVTCRNMLGKI